MKCEKCGKEINSILVNEFLRDGSDKYIEYPLSEVPENAGVIDTNKNWTGYELSEEERRETIVCPNCKQFPFACKEIQEEEIIRIVCFKREDNAARPRNYDRVRNMTIDELAKFIADCSPYEAGIYTLKNDGAELKEKIKKWLEQAAAE